MQVSNFVPFVIKFCKPGQILAEIAPNAAQSNGDHAWQPSFAAEIAKLLRFFEGGRRSTMGSCSLIPTIMPTFGKFHMYVIITSASCDLF
jgi:hypothetical protein